MSSSNKAAASVVVAVLVAVTFINSFTILIDVTVTSSSSQLQCALVVALISIDEMSWATRAQVVMPTPRGWSSCAREARSDHGLRHFLHTCELLYQKKQSQKHLCELMSWWPFTSLPPHHDRWTSLSGRHHRVNLPCLVGSSLRVGRVQ